jgi:hypothetical protein
MNPVFRRLTNKILLFPSGRRIPHYWMPSRPHQIIQLRQLQNKRIIIIFKKRLSSQPSSKHRLQLPFRSFLENVSSSPTNQSPTHIMLFNNLGKARIVQLRKLGKIMNIRNNITQILFQQDVVLLGRCIARVLIGP